MLDGNILILYKMISGEGLDMNCYGEVLTASWRKDSPLQLWDYATLQLKQDIEWSFKGSMLSPVAIIEPVELCGTTVSRASLHNINIMEELGVEIGKLAMITKRGEIIPKVEKCLEQKDL